MKRLVGDGVHGLLGSPAFQHRPGKHDLPGSSAVVAQPVLVERLDRDLCPVRHPQHGKLIGGQLLCQFGLAVQRRRFPDILRKAGQEFLFVELRRCFRLRLRGCRCGQVHPAAPHAPARRHCQQERCQQHAEPAAVLPDAVLSAQEGKVVVPAAAALPSELPEAPAPEPEHARKPEDCQQHPHRPDLPERCQRKQQLRRQQRGAPQKERPADHAGRCCRGQTPPE